MKTVVENPHTNVIDVYLGTNVFVQTVTHYYTGHLQELDDDSLLLTDAAWVASTGRFANAFATGQLSEVEPLPGEVVVSRGAVVAVIPWGLSLPRGVVE